MFKIYSDESGSWNNTDRYYLRAWIRIHDNNDQQRIDELAEELKTDIGCKELTWDIFKNNYYQHDTSITQKFNQLLCIVETHFVTISSPTVILDTVRAWKSYQYIDQAKEHELTGASDDIGITKNKLLTTVEHTLFMIYYERQHTQNARTVLNHTDESQWIIDSPQSANKLWKEVTTLSSVEINDSHKITGIQVADIFAGCYQDLLQNTNIEDREFACQVYQSLLKGKVAYKYKYPSPNIIYYNPNDHQFIKDLDKKIRRNIWSK